MTALFYDMIFTTSNMGDLRGACWDHWSWINGNGTPSQPP